MTPDHSLVPYLMSRCYRAECAVADLRNLLTLIAAGTPLECWTSDERHLLYDVIGGDRAQQ